LDVDRGSVEKEAGGLDGRAAVRTKVDDVSRVRCGREKSGGILALLLKDRKMDTPSARAARQYDVFASVGIEQRGEVALLGEPKSNNVDRHFSNA
jgi:hypothetical protein